MRLPGLASLALVLVLTGCGGATSTHTRSPAIPHSTAERLAAQSESIAERWPADPCGAAKEADDFKDAVVEAIASGEIPAAYQEELEAAAVNLQNTANCPTESAEGDEHGNGKGHGNGNANGHDKHDDEGALIPADTIGATTEGEG
jgi:hypothetical protein